MNFAHTWQLVLAGRKTQTRRIAKGQEAPWLIGRTYAVQPGRCCRAVGRILVTNLRREPLGQVTDADARAEGVADREAYVALWAEIHGRFDPEWLVDVVEFRLATTDELSTTSDVREA